MNANELADELEACFTKADWSVLEAATMLRQQQAEIKVLKKKIQNMALDLLTAHAQADDNWVELQQLKKAQKK